MRGTPVYAVGKQISLPRDDGIGHVGDVFLEDLSTSIKHDMSALLCLYGYGFI